MKRSPRNLVHGDPHPDSSAHRCQNESGDTLIEILIAIVVISMVAVSVLAAFGTAIMGATTYQSNTTFDTVLRTAAEDAVTQLQEQLTTQWGQCPGTSVNVNSVLPSGYTAAISTQYWNGQSFQTTCIADSAEQETITITHNSAIQSINVVADDPVVSPFAVGQTASKLAFVEQPSSSATEAQITAGAYIAPSTLQVAVEDAKGNVVTTDLSSASLAYSPGPATCTGTENQGVFSFGSCSVTKTGSYTLTATDGSLSATSLAFIVVPSIKTQLIYATAPPSSTTTNTKFSVVVDEEDIYGNIVTTDSTTTVILAATSTSNGSGGFSCSSTSVTVVSGVATFSSCSFTTALASGYTISATSGSLTPVSAVTKVPR
jgi:type II secretory pathway pseudopilin PulG